MAVNIRKIRAWRALTVSGHTGTRRARRYEARTRSRQRRAWRIRTGSLAL
jgi:hypothetical protein